MLAPLFFLLTSTVTGDDVANVLLESGYPPFEGGVVANVGTAVAQSDQADDRLVLVSQGIVCAPATQSDRRALRQLALQSRPRTLFRSQSSSRFDQFSTFPSLGIAHSSGSCRFALSHELGTSGVGFFVEKDGKTTGYFAIGSRFVSNVDTGDAPDGRHVEVATSAIGSDLPPDHNLVAVSSHSALVCTPGDSCAIATLSRQKSTPFTGLLSLGDAQARFEQLNARLQALVEDQYGGSPAQFQTARAFYASGLTAGGLTRDPRFDFNKDVTQ